jgi:putative membrane-bound dehydrogenase-like protein
VKPFEINDEWYYHMRFRENMEGVTPILTDLPGPETLKRPDGAHSGNPHVRAALERKEPQHVAWASERPNGGRGFGFTGGHYHWNWGDPNFRKLVLNAIVWAAHGEVPENGIGDKPVSFEQLEENQDYDQPGNFNREAIRERFHLTSTTSGPKKQAKRARGPGPKPKFSTKVITTKTPGHAAEIDVDISGAKKLFLVVNDGGNGFSCDWADWAEPLLIGPDGEKKLTDLKWSSATTAFGQVRVGKNASGNPLKIAGKSVAFGIGTHANSIIAYDLPAGFTRFTARGGLDNGGTDQSTCGENSSVQFQVFTERPRLAVAAKANNAPSSHEAEDALEQLAVHEQLDVSMFAAEPIMRNPTNIDIDHLGRVWICEVINYRLFANKVERKEGDRILILEDTDHDGKADKASTFYQGRDIDSAHGICVMSTPSGKGTRALVSAKDSVFYLIDDDGDLKADRKEILFTGISGTEHDHGIHAFVFGPDGKLYFNFGNAGKQIRDRNGKPIIDLAGNEVNDRRKPYQHGMVFRCNLDGSEFETLGWNFRNNWEVTVDSFGTLWQSDNDDDGNRGTRINFVMEFGNYGYVDEFSGAGWRAERPGMHKEIPKRHWHLNDPGVVPNMLQTGAGSPTGICVYEGTLLPKIFQGQLFHTDAGPNVCRSYSTRSDGAGYAAESLDVLQGAGNKWFRPSDVCVAPDGSVLIADWYDPGVGGHRMQDIEHGRLFRVTPLGHDGKYVVPKQDFSSLDGMLVALNNPALSVRTMAWTALHKQGNRAEATLLAQFTSSSDPRARARALWLLGKIEGRGPHYVDLALGDKDANIRIVGLRLARQLKLDVIPLAKRMVKDASPQVRREVAVAIRHNTSAAVPGLWAELAQQYDGKDRWYLEALGIAADRQWNACLDAWLKKTGDAWATPAGRDIVWRSRATRTPELLAKIVTDPKTPVETHPRYMRAFDFLSGPEKDKALKTILLGL